MKQAACDLETYGQLALFFLSAIKITPRAFKIALRFTILTAQREYARIGITAT
ncbi:MAG: hypothetical protein ABI901_04165 [Roseiflexaceae bacterium]